mmetsp:Transcript_6051/g.15407  ORF Transcript_6051/g.15407 Transcript_6051/m.15407 type:complete len:770 (+) Transcript_6051:275-2584(+)
MAQPPPPRRGSAPPQNSQYFSEQGKKGEVNELRTLLRSPAVERDPKRKREVIKKVIAYMTLGIDVSPLFSQMVMSVETRDLVVKKMVYHYLCSYAHEQPEMGLMCVNTLQRDCSNDDPMVRGLALRNLCSLRLPILLEYIQPLLRGALKDRSAYVRRTAVMGVLKVYHMDQSTVRSSDLIDVLYDMLRDTDGMVVSNCVVVLDEIMLEEGGIAINKAIVHHLLSSLNDFNEWGLCATLKLAARYSPESDDERFQVMNVLDPVLRTSNAGVVLEAIGCFVQLTKDLPELHAQVYERLKAPLLTLMSKSNNEGLYCLLKHAELLVFRCREVFASEYRQFYIRYDEPACVKHQKVQLLAQLASESSAEDILSELREYASDCDPSLAKAAIRATGVVASRLRSKAEACCSLLVEFLDLEYSYVKAEALLVAKDVLRKYPERRGDVLPSLGRYLGELDAEEPQGRAAALFLVGQWGEEIPSAPYVLEPLIDAYATETSVDVKLALLTATCRLFFKRPPEVQNMLGRLLDHALEDQTSSDVRDKALLYFRLLRRDVNVAQRVISGRDPCSIQGAFAEDNCAVMDRLVDEAFNTLAVVYGETPDQFVDRAHRARDKPTDEDVTSETPLVSNDAPPPAAPVEDSFDLLGSEDVAPPAPPSRSLVESAGSVTGDLFQAKWAAISDQDERTLRVGPVTQGADLVDAMLASLHVHTMASGQVGEELKFFVYARDSLGALYLAQAVISTASMETQLTVKTEGAGDASFFAGVVEEGLRACS